jgi:hypothetical protein
LLGEAGALFLPILVTDKAENRHSGGQLSECWAIGRFRQSYPRMP